MKISNSFCRRSLCTWRSSLQRTRSTKSREAANYFSQLLLSNTMIFSRQLSETIKAIQFVAILPKCCYHLLSQLVGWGVCRSMNRFLLGIPTSTFLTCQLRSPGHFKYVLANIEGTATILMEIDELQFLFNHRSRQNDDAISILHITVYNWNELINADQFLRYFWLHMSFGLYTTYLLRKLFIYG